MHFIEKFFSFFSERSNLRHTAQTAYSRIQENINKLKQSHYLTNSFLIFIFIRIFNSVISSLSPFLSKFINTCRYFEQKDPLVARFSNKVYNCLHKMKKHYSPAKLKENRADIHFMSIHRENWSAFFCSLTIHWCLSLTFDNTLRSSLVGCPYPGLMWQKCSSRERGAHSSPNLLLQRVFFLFSAAPREQIVVE